MYLGPPCYGYVLNYHLDYLAIPGTRLLCMKKQILFYLFTTATSEIQICSNKHETGLVQCNYQAFIVLNRKKKKKYKGLIAHTNARTHTNTFSNDYFYPCHYFPPKRHLFEILKLHVQVQAAGLG